MTASSTPSLTLRSSYLWGGRNPERETIQKPHDYQQVVFALIENGTILLEYCGRKDDKYYGYTIIPGGSVEPGETPEEAVKRETLEEFSTSSHPTPLYAGTVIDYDAHGAKHNRHVYIIDR